MERYRRTLEKLCIAGSWIRYPLQARPAQMQGGEGVFSHYPRSTAPPRVMRKRSTAHDDRGRHMATVKSSCHRLILFAFALSLLSSPLAGVAKEPMLAGVGAAMQEMAAKNEIAGAVTVVVTPDKIVHLETTGF